MRIRSTKPEFWRSKTIAALPWDVRLVLKGLESYVDDNGVGKDDIALIASDVFPRDLSGNPRETLARLTEAISLLHSRGLIARYEVDGEDLLYIDKWKDLQRIDKPGKGRFPRPDGTLEYIEDVIRESYGRPPEVVAPVTGEQGNRGTDTFVQPPVEPDEPKDPYTELFKRWWDVYPRKESKGDAFKAWETLRKARQLPKLEDLVPATNRYAIRVKGKDPEFTKLPAGWLRDRKWEDESSAAPTEGWGGLRRLGDAS